MAIWITALAVVALLALYAWWTARRLDRLHARLDAARSAFDQQLERRAEAAIECALHGHLPQPMAGPLRTAGAAATAQVGQLDRDREVAENALSDAISALVTGVPEAFVSPSQAMASLLDRATRAAFARRFYNDAVRDVLVVRDRRIVRYLKLAGYAPRPSYVEMDDGVLPPPVAVAGARENVATAQVAPTVESTRD